MRGNSNPRGFIARVRKHPSQPTGGVSAKRRGGCVGRKSLATAQIVMTAERHPRLRGGGSEGTKIPAAVQAFGPPEKRILFQVHSGRSTAW
jgi:hypothetical protein